MNLSTEHMTLQRLCELATAMTERGAGPQRIDPILDHINCLADYTLLKKQRVTEIKDD